MGYYFSPASWMFKMIASREASNDFVGAFTGGVSPVDYSKCGLFPGRPTQGTRRLVNQALQLMHTSGLGTSRLTFIGAPVWTDPAAGESPENLYHGATELQNSLAAINVDTATGIFLEHHNVSPFLGAQLTHSVLAMARTYVADIRKRQPGAGILAETELCHQRGVPVVWLVSEDAFAAIAAGDPQQKYVPSYRAWSSKLVVDEKHLPEMLFNLSNTIETARDFVFGGRAIPEYVNFMITSFLFNYATTSPEFLQIAEKAVRVK